MSGWSGAIRPDASRVWRVIALVLAMVGTTGIVDVPPADAAGTRANAVTWKQDDVAKTITATIRITLVPTCKAGYFATKYGLAGATECTVTDAIANQVKSSIEAIWNGHTYYCYDVIVKVDIRIDNDPDSPDPTDRIKVRVDRSPSSTQTFTKSKNNTTGTWNGNSQSDALTPVNNGAGSSTWAYPPLGGMTNIYAHEAGHILGLHDGYTRDANGDPVDIPDAPDDLMKNEANPTIDISTIRRMVERAGSHVTGKKCDSTLDGTWLAKGTYSVGLADGKQEWNTTISSISGVTQVTGRGNFVYTDLQKGNFGYVVTTTKGTAAGQATLTVDDELVAHINMREQVHTYTVTTNKGGKGHDQNAPLEQYDQAWQPIGKCAP